MNLTQIDGNMQQATWLCLTLLNHHLPKYSNKGWRRLVKHFYSTYARMGTADNGKVMWPANFVIKRQVLMNKIAFYCLVW